MEKKRLKADESQPQALARQEGDSVGGVNSKQEERPTSAAEQEAALDEEWRKEVERLQDGDAEPEEDRDEGEDDPEELDEADAAGAKENELMSTQVLQRPAETAHLEEDIDEADDLDEDEGDLQDSVEEEEEESKQAGPGGPAQVGHAQDMRDEGLTGDEGEYEGDEAEDDFDGDDEEF